MNNERIYCTLFDKNYLLQGLSLYHSLLENEDSFKLYIFAFDDFTYDFFNNSIFDKIIIVKLFDFENADLLAVKTERTKGEYCWTCTPAIIKYVLEHYHEKECTYLDSDIYFFNSPKPIFEENKNYSIILTKHNYARLYNQERISGKYCVQFITFKNNTDGLEALNWWYERCLEWCFARFEDGKMGDQKYLDNWENRFNNVHIVTNIGAGLAPWNSIKYNINFKNGEIKLKYKNQIDDLIFFHFHNLRIKEGYFDPGVYRIKKIIKKIYIPYIEKVRFIQNKYNLDDSYFPKVNVSKGLSFKNHFSKLKNRPVNEFLIYFLRVIFRENNKIEL